MLLHLAVQQRPQLREMPLFRLRVSACCRNGKGKILLFLPTAQAMMSKMQLMRVGMRKADNRDSRVNRY